MITTWPPTTVAGSGRRPGCDAQPWFRIFNPVTQSERFDREGPLSTAICPRTGQLPTKYIHFPAAMPPLQLQGCGTPQGRTTLTPL